MAKKEARIKDLEREIEQPDFWSNQEKATKISQELADLRGEVELWQRMEKEGLELIEMLEMLDGEKDESLKKEIEKRYQELKKKFNQEELKVFFSGQYDRARAILSIYAGAGGREAQDWAEMLLRMYLKYAQRKNYPVKVLEISPGQEAGIKQVTLLISAPYAYGQLKKESGVHRLVRLSPFNADHLRHTSFALVEVLPELEELAEIEIKPQDLRIDTYRASGPGGQYVNKTESAVRITHLPTGLTVACQSERLQGENKKRALKLLYTKLHQYLSQEKEKEKSKIRGKKVSVGWGHQVRSYILHPYKMVKDLRTGVVSQNPDKVLDGDLDVFIESEIKLLPERPE